MQAVIERAVAALDPESMLYVADENLRVIGVDGQIGPVIDAALDHLVHAGWLTPDQRLDIPLVYETSDTGLGWFQYHHHHLHVGMHE